MIVPSQRKKSVSYGRFYRRPFADGVVAGLSYCLLLYWYGNAILLAVAHYYYIKTNKPVYKNVTRAWSKGVAIFFATGAVSGTVLSFELGLLWPKFMLHAGLIFGLPFSLEGTAFFIEAIALFYLVYDFQHKKIVMGKSKKMQEG